MSARLASALLGMLMCAASAAGAAERARITGIEVTGVSVITDAQVESALEVVSGDPQDGQRIERSAENLRSVLALRGYEQARVSIELRAAKKGDGKTLVFQVNEGPPTRVAWVKVNLLGLSSREKAELSLDGRTEIGMGDIFDQETVAAAKRKLLEALASEEYVGGKSDEARATTVERPVGRGDLAGRWIGLEFVVDPGDRVTFGFRDNLIFSHNDLTAVVTEQRVVGLGRDYVAAIRAKIEEKYKLLGYAHAQALPLNFEESANRTRHITYRIIEGEPVRIDSISFDGNVRFDEDVLRKSYLSRSAGVVRNGFYSSTDVERGAELLIDWMKSQGYLSAKLVTIGRKFTPDKLGVDIVIYLYEGEETRVRSVKVEGVGVFSDSELRRILNVGEGAPLNLFAFNEGIEALKAAYREKGYLGVRIANEGTDQVVQYSVQNKIADLWLEVAEGYQYRVSRIDIVGLDKTNVVVAERELALKEGDVIEEGKVLESEARLRKLGIFSGASIRMNDDPRKPGHKILRVQIQEGTPGVLAGGVGLRNDLGVRLFGQAGYSNLWWRNHTATASFYTNRRFKPAGDSALDEVRRANAAENNFLEYQAQIAYVWPWQLWGDTTFRPSIQVEHAQYINFDAFSRSILLAWDRPILRQPSLSAGLTTGIEVITQRNASDAIDNSTIQFGTITPSLKFDRRDNPLAPTRGIFSLLSVEVALPRPFSQIGTSAIGFTRTQLRADYFLPLSRSSTWYFSARGGYARSLVLAPTLPNGASADEIRRNAKDPTGSIPLSKHFTLGGASSVRGFDEQEINLGDLLVRGEMSFVNYRTQIDLPFAGSLRWGPFVDAGNVFAQFDVRNEDKTTTTLGERFSFTNVRVGAGVGFHYQTPVGPVNLDWGFNLKPRSKGRDASGNILSEAEDPWKIHFSIGII